MSYFSTVAFQCLVNFPFEGGGLEKMIMSFVLWATLNFLKHPLLYHTISVYSLQYTCNNNYSLLTCNLALACISVVFFACTVLLSYDRNLITEL